MGDLMIELQEALILSGRASYTYGETIDERGIEAITRAVNHGYATTGLKTSIGVWNTPIRTTSTTWTQQNSINQNDLDDYNTTIRPARAEIGGLERAGSSDAYVLVFEAFGSAIDLRITLDGCREGQPPGSQEGQATLSFGETTSWQRAVIVIDNGNAAAFKTKLEFLWNQSGANTDGKLYAATLEEIRYVNLAYDQKAAVMVYGSEYVGMYANGQNIESWDSDGIELAFHTADGGPSMRRNLLASGVHGVFFDGSSWMETDNFSAGHGGGGVLFGAAFRSSNTNTELVMAKQAGGSIHYLYKTGSTIYGFVLVDNGAGGFTTHSVSTSGFTINTWHDVAVHFSQDQGTLRLIVNGTMVDEVTGISSAFFDDDGTLKLGTYNGGDYLLNGDIGMPYWMPEAFTHRQVDRFMEWRRSMHGLY